MEEKKLFDQLSGLLKAILLVVQQDTGSSPVTVAEMRQVIQMLAQLRLMWKPYLADKGEASLFTRCEAHTSKLSHPLQRLLTNSLL